MGSWCTVCGEICASCIWQSPSIITSTQQLYFCHLFWRLVLETLKLGVAKVSLSRNENLVANDPGSLCSPVSLDKKADIRDPAFLAGITSVFICILSSIFSDAKHYVISCGVSCHHSEMFPIYIKGLFFYPISNCLDRLKSLSAWFNC